MAGKASCTAPGHVSCFVERLSPFSWQYHTRPQYALVPYPSSEPDTPQQIGAKHAHASTTSARTDQDQHSYADTPSSVPAPL
eukprot:855779-Rhodomonas_salina.7